MTHDEIDWEVLFQPWDNKEGEVRPERNWTPWAHPGWLSWNANAAEVQVADFLAQLARMQSAETGGSFDDGEWVGLETGVGQGYITRRIVSAVNPAKIRGIWCFESELEWNGRIRQLPFWPDNLHSCIKWEITPTPKQMEQADLVILDSRKPWRQIETMMWSEVGKEGSLLFVHDTGTLHPTRDGHFSNGFMIQQLGIEGIWLENPRGSFLAQKGLDVPYARYKALWDLTLEQVYSFE